MIQKPIRKGRFYKDKWLELFDGGSDQWLYVARDGLYTFFFIDIVDLPAYCGRDAHVRWVAEVSIVDLLEINPRDLISAVDSCGGKIEEIKDNYHSDDGRLRLAEMCHSYGLKALVWSESGGELTFDKNGSPNFDYNENDPVFRNLKKRAREYCERYLAEESSRNEILDTKIVNKIGQTAREILHGTEGLWDTLRKIKKDGNASEEQKLALRLYQKAGQTLGAGPVPKDIMATENEKSQV